MHAEVPCTLEPNPNWFAGMAPWFERRCLCGSSDGQVYSVEESSVRMGGGHHTSAFDGRHACRNFREGDWRLVGRKCHF